MPNAAAFGAIYNKSTFSCISEQPLETEIGLGLTE